MSRLELDRLDTCPICEGRLQYATIVDDKHDDTIEVAEFCTVCDYAKTY